jgi:hypothetical protein
MLEVHHGSCGPPLGHIAQAHPLPPPCLDRSMDQAGGGPQSLLRSTERSDLDDDRQHHRPPLEAVVDERREIVVQHLLEQVRLADLLLGGAIE